MAGDLYTVAILDQDKVKNVIHGLAYIKTLATKSGVSADGYSLAGQVTNISVGENFTNGTFKRWVKEEEKQLVNAFQEACKRGVTAGCKWIQSAVTARGQYFQNYQTVIDETNKINAQLGDAYLIGARTAAVAQFAAETALVGYSLFGGAASMTVKLALQKFAVGVGSSVAISVAEDWSQSVDSDLLLMTAGKSAENVPGTVDDVFKDIINGLNSLTVAGPKNRLAALEKQIAENVAYKNKLPKGARGTMQAFLRSLYNDRKLIEQQIKNPGVGKGIVAKTLGRGFGILNWGLAIKSEIDNTNKLLKHWNGEL